jgi:hypothetical protein
MVTKGNTQTEHTPKGIKAQVIPGHWHKQDAALVISLT